ncbi:MAG: FAD-binding oxidoreductase [Proteobacteria bacterium]|nr:FAD-binding oxidoreductase [Pseudomonadota bacterium]HQR03018.1 FAD-binding oxidoreductase [Rhodocyclaceae bacterium]
MTSLLNALRGALGDAYVLTDESSMAAYCLDWRGRYQGQALCVARPGNTAEVSAVVRMCADHGVAVVPQGGNTGLCGGATPQGGEVVLSLCRLNRIRAVDSLDNTLTAESGCTLHEVQVAAAGAERLFPLSLASEGTATLGGNLSTNAGGVQVLRYGNARDLVLGLEVVLPDGRLWSGLRRLRKDNTGYDIKHLFIGAEGTLGVITAATLKLFPPLRSRATAWAAVADPDAAVALLARLLEQTGHRVSAFEIVGRAALDLVLRHIPGSRDPLAGQPVWQVLIELTDTQQADLDARLSQCLADTGDVSDAVVARSVAQATALWALRENISEAQRCEGFSIKHDVAVPVSCIPEFINQAGAALSVVCPDVRVVCFGHIGDGNLHYNLSHRASADNAAFIARSGEISRIVHDIVHALGGSISAEHGVGQLKREEIRRYKSGIELDVMRAIKRTLDPAGLMNPGKVL